MLELKSPVEAKVETKDGDKLEWQRGILIGRTHETNPRYDVTLADGRMVGNLPADRVRLLTEKAVAA